MIENKHIPVMLNEVESFIPKDKKLNIIDATFGGGGYSKSLLQNFNIEKLIAIDRDPISEVFAKELINNFDNFTLINGRFSQIDKLVLKQKNTKKNDFDIIIFDLGVSSNQIDNSSRGFSFKSDGPLDMSMDNETPKVSEIINRYPEKKLAEIIYKFGEERFSRKIASNIVRARQTKLIESTTELAKLIKSAYNIKQTKKSKIDPATKTFQAFRIKVNNELEELSYALEDTKKLLLPGARLVVITFHSLEDKIVKNFFNFYSNLRNKPSRYFPSYEEKTILFNLKNKKPIQPDDSEIKNNIRSRSAKLRYAIRNNDGFFYPTEFKEKFINYFELEGSRL